MGSSVMLNCNGNTLQWHCIVPYFICMALYTFKYTIMVTLYHNMFSHNIVYDYGIIGILPLSHFNRQDKLRSREVKPDAGSHIAGRWPRWDSYPDVPDSRFRGCSPSQTERGCTKQGFHVFGRMQLGGCLWVGSSLVGPHTKRPHRQRQCIRASLSVQRTLGQRGHTPSGWGKCQETYLKDSKCCSKYLKVSKRCFPDPCISPPVRFPDHSPWLQSLLTISSGIKSPLIISFSPAKHHHPPGLKGWLRGVKGTLPRRLL